MQGGTCLSGADTHALAALYPDCLGASAARAPVCPDARRHIWAFRLALVVTPALTLFIAAMLPATLIVRAMSRRRVSALAKLLQKTISVEQEAARLLHTGSAGSGRPAGGGEIQAAAAA